MSDALGLDVGVVTLTTYDGGYLGVSVDGYGEEQSGLAPGDGHHLYGFIGRPRDPDASGVGALTLRANEGGQLHAWICEDSRDRPKLPLLPKGSSAQYNARGAFVLLDYDSARGVAYYPNKAATKAQIATFDPEAQTVHIVNTDGSFFMGGGGGWTLMSANGQNWIRVDDSGVSFGGPVSMPGGAVVGNPLTAVPVLVGLSGPAGVASTVFKASVAP